MFIEIKKETSQHYVKMKNGDFGFRKGTKTIYCLKCDQCGKEFTRQKGSMSASRLNNDYKHYCQDCFDYGTVADVGRATKITNLESRIGERRIDSEGYVNIYVGPKTSDKCLYAGIGHYCGSVREHILVMERHIERPIKKGEAIHHIDGDKTNNNIKNLQLMTVAEHNACHAANDRLIMELYRSGIVVYDRKSKKYLIKDQS